MMDEPPQPEPARCRCGYDASSGWIERKPRYTGWTWFLVLFGISATPERIDLVCRRCGDKIGAIDDQAVLSRET